MDDIRETMDAMPSEHDRERACAVFTLAMLERDFNPRCEEHAADCVNCQAWWFIDWLAWYLSDVG